MPCWIRDPIVGRQEAPEFQFTDLQGKPWSSQAIAGKSAVIYFWKSDITEADPMIATIEQFYGNYKKNDKLAILAVTLDHPDTPAKTMRKRQSS